MLPLGMLLFLVCIPHIRPRSLVSLSMWNKHAATGIIQRIGHILIIMYILLLLVYTSYCTSKDINAHHNVQQWAVY